MISDTHLDRDESAAAREAGSVARLDRWIRRNWPQVVVAVLASIPAFRMLAWISSGTHVQFADYWVFLSELINPDGSVHWGALTEFQGQHILSIPFLIYLINIWLFGGSNIALGFIVVGVVLAQLVVLWSWLRRLEHVPFVLQGALLVLASALLFSPYGAWNFLKAMSGTAWLTSNLMVMIAIHLAVRGRLGASMAAAVLATLTYGTGVLVWPVLVFVAIVRRDSVRAIVTVSAAAVAMFGGYMVVRSSQVWTDTVKAVDPVDIIPGVARMLGRLAGVHPHVVLIVGTTVLISSIALAVLGLRRFRDQSLPFVALLSYGVLAAGQIAYGRGGDAVNASRYTSLVALVWVATAVLLIAVVRSYDSEGWARPLSAALFVAVCLVAVSSPFRGQVEIRRSLDESAHIVRLSDAQRLKISQGSRWFFLIEQPDVDDRLERIGHHPFDGRWNADCGWLDRSFDQPTAPAVGEARYPGRSGLPDGIRIVGWLDVGDAEVDCLILLDDADTVVGVGRTYPDVEVERGIDLTAYAPLTSDPARMVAHLPGSDEWVELPIAGSPPGDGGS